MKNSDKLQESFNFYFDCFEKLHLFFYGSNPDFIIEFNSDDKSAIKCFADFENGIGRDKVTKHFHFICSEDQILNNVITGKKSYGFQVKIWKEGFKDKTCDFLEILELFIVNRVDLPHKFYKELLGIYNRIDDPNINDYQTLANDKEKYLNWYENLKKLSNVLNSLESDNIPCHSLSGVPIWTPEVVKRLKQTSNEKQRI